MAQDKWIWVTWVNNGRSCYNGKTHKVPQDTIVEPSENLKEGDQITVYWEGGKRKFWNAVVAAPITTKRSSSTDCPIPAKKPNPKQKLFKKTTSTCKFLTPAAQSPATNHQSVAVQTARENTTTSVATQTAITICKYIHVHLMFYTSVHYFLYVIQSLTKVVKLNRIFLRLKVTTSFVLCVCELQ